MHSVANKLAQYGRGGDDTLVHMNKAEVAGLNALNHVVNNRPLSTNPVTGMPEAMDLTDILAGLGIGVAAALTGGAAAAAAGPIAGILAGAGTGAALNTGKAAIKGDENLGQAAMFGGLSGAIGGAGASFGGAAEGAAANTGTQAAEKSIEEAAKQALEKSTESGIASLTPSVSSGSTLATSANNVIPSSFASLDAAQAGVSMPLNADAVITPGFGGVDVGKSAIGANASQSSLLNPGFEQIGKSTTGLDAIRSGVYTPLNTDAASTALTPRFEGASIGNPAKPGPWEQSFAGLKNTIMNPMQHQGLLAAQVGAAGLEDQYKQQGLNEQAGAKQAADIVAQYKAAGIMPSELPKGLTDIANKRKSFAAGGTIRDVQGIGAIPTGYINQQPMTNFYPQSMIPQAQPLQSTQPIRHEVIGYADGGQVGYGYAEGGDVGGGDEGLLHGPGTGQSDGIAGLIEGPQSQEPVRLADSEFVIPADVVSALGSGSTKAGARVLYEMLDRVRQQAYGHIQQANPVDPSKVLPA